MPHDADQSTRRGRKLRGDFQTPAGLVDAILEHLSPILSQTTRVLEPTCGVGGFLSGLIRRGEPGWECVGIERDPSHHQQAEMVASEARIGSMRVIRADLAEVDLGALSWFTSGRLLVVGNLPWVTSAELGAHGVAVPIPKRNTRRLPGVAARTGEANFDIAEGFLSQIVRQLADEEPIVALLVKLATARSLFRWLDRDALPVRSLRFHRIDARRWFGVAVEAGLLVIEVGPGPRAQILPVHPTLDDPVPATVTHRVGSFLVTDRQSFEQMDSPTRSPGSPTWRQGIKHDAAEVMELTESNGVIRNRRGEVVDVEPEFLYPLHKGSDLAVGEQPHPRRWLIVPQRTLRDRLDDLSERAPRLSDYLLANAERFDRRRSSIYRNRPRFAIFGVGDYSFAPYKVAISGLHKTPRFRLVEPVAGRPVVFDDTCYFLPFADHGSAETAMELLNGPVAQRFIRSIWFPEAKRPITKSILSQINLEALRHPRF